MKSALLSTSLSDAQWTEHLPSVCEIIAELLNNLNSSLSFEQGGWGLPPLQTWPPATFIKKIEEK